MSEYATYSPEDDKLRIYSGRVDAETYARLRAVGYQRAYKQECFYVVWNPAAEDLARELAGEIGDEDTSLVERAEARAERFEGYQERRTADAERAHAAVHAIADNIPLGQPILVGHHSERHARRDAEKIENGMRKAVKMWETAKHWEDRAAGALRHAKFKERPDVRARRIKGLESDIRVYRSKFTPIGKQVVMQTRWNASEGAPKIPHVWCAPRGGRGGSWVAVEDLPGIERHYSRWIAHAENRLVYERAMLDEQGGSDLLKPKPRSKAAQLPLCNYRAPEGLDIENIYHRGEMIHYPQVEMTKAEFADICADYKGTRVVGNSHRVRTAMRRGSLCCVFITDAKVHAVPAPIEREAATEPRRWPVPQPEPERTEQETRFDDLKKTLDAGVKVVSAPQLFPTPAHLALRMVRLADLKPGCTILEPSAGTGRIVEAIRQEDQFAQVVAVEVSHSLASALAHRFDWLRVRCDDFLSCDGSIGTFDRILMNPPFANGADIEHIEHAFKLLNPGGVLVAIAANGPRQQAKLQPMVEQYGGTWEPLPAGTFEESGTGVNTVLLTMHKPAFAVALEMCLNGTTVQRQEPTFTAAELRQARQSSLFVEGQ